MSTFGKKTSKPADWFEAYLRKEKRKALAIYKASPSEYNLQILWSACSKVLQCTRRCANNCTVNLLQLNSQIQTAADTGNNKRLYDSFKQALGPTQKKTAPLKSTTGEEIHDRSQQMDHWVEHYSQLWGSIGGSGQITYH